jgi:hypothetical protein
MIEDERRSVSFVPQRESLFELFFAGDSMHQKIA